MDILKAIPHRPPFLFVDRVTDIGEKSIRAEKTLGADLDFFRGHYPAFPIAPGVIILESIFQAGAILLSGAAAGAKGAIPALTRIRDARFKKMARPGDTLEIEASVEDRIGHAFYMKGSAKVNGALAASVSFTCAMISPDSLPGGEVER